MLESFSPIHKSQSALERSFKRERDYIHTTYLAGGMGEEDYEQEIAMLEEQRLHAMGKFF